MRKLSKTKRAYISPSVHPTEVAFEQSLLVDSVQNTMQIISMGIDVQYFDFSPDSEEYEIDWE